MMALLVILTLGAAIGWMAAIITRQDSVAQSFTNIGIGAIGALVSHVLIGGGISASSIEAESLLFGGIGAVVFLTAATMFRRRVAG